MSGAPRTAVVLVAGRGTRLGAGAVPKCLLPVAGKPLLARYLEQLAVHGMRARLVTGHGADQVAAAVRALEAEGATELVVNPAFHLGSVISLALGLQDVEPPVLVMDGDVYFHPRVLGALLDEPGEDALAIDFTHAFTGEEYMAGVDGAGRVRSLARRPVEGDRTGEWVGFARLGAEALSELGSVLARWIAEGRTGEGYEDALAGLLPSFDVRAAAVDGLPWVEIDFAEDLENARRLARARAPGPSP